MTIAAEKLAEYMPAEEVPLFQAAHDALLALANARGKDALDTLWWLYAAPWRLTNSSYVSYYGSKEVWTVAIAHPDHKPRGKKR